MSVNLSQVKSELRSHFLPEIIAKIFDLGRVSDSCVRADSDSFFLLYHILLFEKCWIHDWVRCLFSHLNGISQLVDFWLCSSLRVGFIINEHIESLGSVCSAQIFFWKSHWYLGQKEKEVDKGPCCFFKYQGWIRIYVVCSRLD